MLWWSCARLDRDRSSYSVARVSACRNPQRPTAPGRWEYEIDYRGRAGTLDRYKVHYNSAAERFEGTVTYTPDQ